MGSMGENLRDWSRNWIAVGSCLREREVLGACGMSVGNDSSSEMFVSPPTSGIEPTSFPGLQVQSISSSPHLGMGQEHICSRNILLKWSMHPQICPASRREMSSRMTKTQGDNEFVPTYTKLKETR